MTATGPGTAVVTGEVTTRAADQGAPCAYDARLRGYTQEWTGRNRWNLGAVTGEAQLPANWRNGETYSTQISLGVGTDVVCVRTPSSAGQTCWQVFVYAEADGSPSMPVEDDQVWPPLPGRGDGTVDICGNCV